MLGNDPAGSALPDVSLLRLRAQLTACTPSPHHKSGGTHVPGNGAGVPPACAL